MAEERSPFPVPFGWFCIGYPEDFEAGQPQAIYYFDRHLVAWRDETGALHPVSYTHLTLPTKA